MNENETTALVRAFDRAYINGKFVTPHGTQVVDLVNPTNNTVIGKVTMADEIDTRQAIAAAKEAFNTFSQSSKEYRMEGQRSARPVWSCPAISSRCLSQSRRNLAVCSRYPGSGKPTTIRWRRSC